MNILIELGHPGHVHFFRKSIVRLKEEGHSVWVVTRGKEVTNALLDSFGIEYQCLSMPQKGWRLGIELVTRWWKIAQIIRKNKITLVASISGISTALPARLCGIKSITFTDTEDARLSNKIAFPFSSEVHTPSFFLESHGKKHRRYFGLHELSYIQNFDEDRAAQVRKKYDLPDQYVFVRLVANDALHDTGLESLNLKRIKQILGKLERFGKVYLSMQTGLPTELETYRSPVPPSEIHSLLAGARLFVGDSPTMSVECALLGVESHLVSARVASLGNMVALEKMGLLKNYKSWIDFEHRFKPQGLSRKESAKKFLSSAVSMNHYVIETLLAR